MRCVLLPWMFVVFAANAVADVKVLKTPHGGIQPQVAVDAKGTLHLIYFKGDAAAGDLFCLRQDGGKFTAPLRVNSVPGSVVAIGSVRGGQMTLGKDNRIHVVWFGSSKARGKDGGAPLLYSRLDDEGAAFEVQRDLRGGTGVLDGGGSVAADAAGNVYIAWHAVATGDKGEHVRKVWLAVSRDGGKTFDAEKPAWKAPTGACGCCGLKAFADGAAVHVLYRSASNGGADRDIYLLASRDRGGSFGGARVHPWKIATCPMSTLALARGPAGMVAAWDTDGGLFFSRIKSGTAEFATPQQVSGARAAKHPSVAFNRKGEMLIAWAEGTAWMRGGALAWQVYDERGTPTSERGRIAGGIPVWGLPTAGATEAGFVILH